MKRLELVLTPLLVLLLVTSVWTVRLLGGEPFSLEPRPPRPIPDFDAELIADGDFFGGVDAYLQDRMALRGQVAGQTTRQFVNLTGDVPTNNAMIGKDGSLFLVEDYNRPCRYKIDTHQFSDAINRWQQAGSGREIFVVIAPDKSSIQVDEIPARGRLDCQAEREQQLIETFGDDGALIALWDPLRDAKDPTDPYHLYFKHDAHWTYEAGQIMAEQVVEHLAPGQFASVTVEEKKLKQTKGAIARRLGWEEEEFRTKLWCKRKGVKTSQSVEKLGSKDIVTFRTESNRDEPLLNGKTVLLHDSMMRYSDQPLACHFEHIEMIHWDDFETNNAVGRFGDADRIIIQSVERSIHLRVVEQLLDPKIDTSIEAVLAAN